MAERMGFLKTILKKIGGRAVSSAAESTGTPVRAEDTAAPEKDPMAEYVRLGVERANEDIYRDEQTASLARRCSSGDVRSMRDMAQFFRRRCTPPLICLLDRYESEPSAEHERELEEFLRYHFHEEVTAKAYMMWLLRASFYGDPEAQDMLKPWAYYRRKALIPESVLLENKSAEIWTSGFLRRAGLINVPDGYDECSLRFDRETRRYTLTYLSDYEPPDEDGYGAEWEYDDLFFDEFFNRVPGT